MTSSIEEYGSTDKKVPNRSHSSSFPTMATLLATLGNKPLQETILGGILTSYGHAKSPPEGLLRRSPSRLEGHISLPGSEGDLHGTVSPRASAGRGTIPGSA